MPFPPIFLFLALVGDAYFSFIVSVAIFLFMQFVCERAIHFVDNVDSLF